MAVKERSFVPVDPRSHFPIQNLPYGIFRRKGVSEEPRVGVAIGDFVLDLALLDAAGCFDHTLAGGKGVFAQSSLNPFLSLGRQAWREVRDTLKRLLGEGEDSLRNHPDLCDRALVEQRRVELLLPVKVGDYTDFYASKHHAFNCGSIFRGEHNALMPNWVHLPVGYHGRASSIVISGTAVRRPKGQFLPPGASSPVFGPCRKLDFELELGCVIGVGNRWGEPVPVGRAEERIFGFVLVNDWSARDIQSWEYQPLGPFLSKNFATSISPWVVPLEALEPFRAVGPVQEPEPLPYLRQSGLRAFDIHLEIWLQGKGEPRRISVTNARHLYWSMAQMIAHHTVGGCNLEPGDLVASGTISGPDPDSRGCLLELTWNGRNPIRLDGEERVWLEDGDRVIMTGYCQGDGYRIGFGEVSGTILPAY